MDISTLLIIFYYIFLVVTFIFLLLDNRETSKTLAWLFVFITFPVMGLIIYILVGRNWRHLNKKKQLIQQQIQANLAEILAPLITNQENYLKEIEGRKDLAYKEKLFELLYNNSNSILTLANSIEIIQNGAQKFDLLIEDINKAESFIHMEYFTWRNDKLTERMKNILIKKAREGVKVRILYDAYGSLFIKASYVKELRKAGIKMRPYYDFRSLIKIHALNYRNHRKIVIIDGKVGYTGGMNMGQEYVDGGKKFPYWRDTHMRIEGEAVPVLQSVFLTSWYNTTKENLFAEKYFPLKNMVHKKLPVQITTSGPDSQWASIKQLYFSLITSAEKSVYIQTPYFIPDDSIYSALKIAALSGLDVRIMVTGHADKKLPFWSAYTYYQNLLSAGVKVYHYQRGFLHAKTISIDNKICSIGSANMDIRSFQINYELTTLIYDSKLSEKLTADFLEDLKDCNEMTRKAYEELNAFIKFRNSLARLFAPLL